MVDETTVLDDEAEPTTLCDELRPAELGIMPQSTSELREAFDPFDCRSSDFLWENY